MNQGDKKLLIRDLSARLPYGVKVEHIRTGMIGTLHEMRVYPLYDDNDVIYDYFCDTDFLGDDDKFDIIAFKPCLFPLSSMTDEQEKEFALLQTSAGKEGFLYVWNCATMMKWLIENHFDYNNLIPKGLAIDATDKNIY